jgi:hypothetical protein
MATNTYVAIETQTVASTVASVTIGSGGTIPQTYTDLILVVSGKSTSGIVNWGLRFNGDTGSNYSRTLMFGNGSTTGGARQTSSTSANPGFLTTAGSPTIIQIMNYRNTTTYKSWIARAGDASDSVSLSVGMWRGSTGSATNQPITSITLFSDGSTSIAAGTTFTLYGIADARIGAPKAFGGTITQDATYTYHAFGASGTFTPQQALTADVLVVAGGGGAAMGGGGAGGVRAFASQSFGSGTVYTCTVGAGGTAGADGTTRGGTGGATSLSGSGFSTLAVSGGGGAAAKNANMTGLSGGSGGGGGGDNSGSGTIFAGGTGNAGSYSPVEGYAGGSGRHTTGVLLAGGGGGGAGGVGVDAAVATFADGGAGTNTYNSIDFSTWLLSTGLGVNNSSGVRQVGGGGGGNHADSKYIGRATAGGGNATLTGTGTNGVANTGGGAGPGVWNGSVGGAGGSGVIVIRYLTA